MDITGVTAPRDRLQDLKSSLDSGPLYLINGQEVQDLNEVKIAGIGALKVYIYSNEYPPPHFHVKYNGEENSFSIYDGNPLYPNNGLKQYYRNVKKWFKGNKAKLILAWNDNRPADCPVGEIK